MLSLIIEDLGISHAQAGLLMSITMLPCIFLVIPLSLFLPGIGIKRAGIASIVLTLVGAIVFLLARNFIGLLLGRMIMGLGTVALPLVATQAVALWFYGHRIGLAMGIYSATFLFSNIVTLNTFGIAGLAWGWRSTLLIIIAINLIVLIIYARFFKKPPEEKSIQGEHAAISIKSVVHLGRPIWIMASGWALFQAGNMSFATFLPDFIYRQGIDLQVAGSMTSILMLCTLLLSAPLGLLLDRLHHKEMLIMAGAVCSCIVSILLPLYPGLVMLFIVALGISFTPFAATTFAMVPSLVPRHLLPLGFGIIATLSYAGMFSGPSLIGLMRDLTGSYTHSFWLIALFFSVIIVLMAFFGRSMKKAGNSSTD